MFGEEALYRSKAQTIRLIVPVVASNNLPHPLLWSSLTFPPEAFLTITSIIKATDVPNGIVQGRGLSD